MKGKAMPTAKLPVKYQNHYIDGYRQGVSGSKSLVHNRRLISDREYDKGYTDGWNKYTKDTLINLLEGKV